MENDPLLNILPMSIRILRPEKVTKLGIVHEMNIVNGLEENGRYSEQPQL